MAVVNIPRAEDGEAGQALVRSRRRASSPRAAATFRRDFLVELFGRAAPDDLVRYSPEELAGIAEQSWSFSAATQGRRAENRASSPCMRGAGRRGARNRQRRHAVPGRLGARRARRARRSTSACWCIRSSPSSATQRAAHRLQGHAQGRRPRAKASSTSMSSGIDDDGAARRDRARRSKQVLADVRVVRAGLAADAGARSARSSPNCEPIRRRLPADEIAEAIAVPANGSRPTISRCSARATTPTPTASSVLEPQFETGLGLLRSPRHAAAAPRRPARDR